MLLQFVGVQITRGVLGFDDGDLRRVVVHQLEMVHWHGMFMRLPEAGIDSVDAAESRCSAGTRAVPFAVEWRRPIVGLVTLLGR